MAFHTSQVSMCGQKCEIRCACYFQKRIREYTEVLLMDFPTSSINVQIHDEVRPLWTNFHSKTNEMIINKAGRKIYPDIEFNISGLESDMLYVMILKFTSDKYRYRYSCQEWTSNKNDKFVDCKDVILHSDGAQKGQKWMDSPVCFDFVRLTNCPRNKKENMVQLQSHHKYRPVLEIYSIPGGVSSGNFGFAEFTEMQGKLQIFTSGFELMDFIAVTAYQNKEVNDLKKENNKYASAFKAKELKEKERKQTEGLKMQAFANPFMYGQTPYPQFLNYPPYFWNNPAAMMGQFAPFGQMPNQFATGHTTPTGMGNMPNQLGAMSGFHGQMPNMNFPNGMPSTIAPWSYNPASVAPQTCSGQAPPPFTAQPHQMPPFTPPTQFMMPASSTPGVQAPPLTPTSSNQSASSTAASPVPPVALNQMGWPQNIQNYNQNIPNMMNYSMLPQGKLQLDLQNNFNNLQNYNNYNNNSLNSQKNVV